MESSDRTKAQTTADTNATPGQAMGGRTDAPLSGPAATTTREAVTAELNALRVSCLMNARYHATREGFLDNMHRWFMFFIIACGATALVDVFPHKIEILSVSLGVKETATAVAAILAALDLTFDLSNRARIHALMKRRYFELLADIVEDKRNHIEARACLERYSADEEPAYHTLLILSWNAAQEMVYGTHAQRYHVPLLHRIVKNVLRCGGRQYELEMTPAQPGTA